MENVIPSLELRHNDEKVFFAYRSMEENYEKNGGKPDLPHRHEFYTILLLRNACGKHFVDYVEYPMKPGIIFLLSPGQVHQVISNIKPKGDIIMFNDEFLERNYIDKDFIYNLGLFSCSNSVPPIEIPLEKMDQFSAYGNEINLAFNSNDPYKFDIIASYLKLFLINCRSFAVSSQEENPQALESGKQLVRKFKLLLEDNFEKWHRVSTYANTMNITPDYLNNVVKSNIGKTAKELINDRVILEAKRIGLHTQLSNKEIAYQLGFEDPSHFSKFYKNIEGISFAAFRKTLSIQPIIL